MEIIIEMDPYNETFFQQVLREFCAASWNSEQTPPDAFPRRISPAMKAEAARTRFQMLRRIAGKHFANRVRSLEGREGVFLCGDISVRLRPSPRERMLASRKP